MAQGTMAKFLQSQQDFPCLIELGKNVPSFGISRWGKNALRFVPVDDEGFAVHGDRNRLLYKGRRRSHRFTVHSDTSFEYDCILLKEPESNVITLLMEGAENFDFYRQPDFVPDDFLKGSYAVYKKDTLIGQGTGKLCHIHRPLIIDALGRKVWGELAVVGNELRITIPEWWLASAKFPVTVDPTIGTTTIGSQIYGTDPNNTSYDRPYLDNEYAMNKFLISQRGNGQCTAYVYAYDADCYEVFPFLYNQVNNKPYKKISKNEKIIDVEIYGSKKVGWRNNNFNLNDDILSGDYIWFGICSSWFSTRFDYGLECYKGWFDWEEYPDYEQEATPFVNIGSTATFCNIKWSMYFTYTAVQTQNYTRTITQSVNLSESARTSSEYKRISSQTTQVNEIRNLKAEYNREATENVNGSTAVNPLFTFFRQCFETISNTIGISRLPVFNRYINNDLLVNETVNNNREINIKCDDVINNSDLTNRSQGFNRAITENIITNDTKDYTVLILRTIQETQNITDKFQQVRDYIRCLKIETSIIAETERSGDFYRTESETVNVNGFSFRHLLIFIKLLSASLVKDFILKRFLVSKEQIELKSLITKDLRIESKIA